MSTTKKNATPKLFKPVFTALLSALIVLLTFTVGTLRVGPLVFTLNCLPVAVGAVFLGPLYGAILGKALYTGDLSLSAAIAEAGN